MSGSGEEPPAEERDVSEMKESSVEVRLLGSTEEKAEPGEIENKAELEESGELQWVGIGDRWRDESVAGGVVGAAD